MWSEWKWVSRTASMRWGAICIRLSVSDAPSPASTMNTRCPAMTATQGFPRRGSGSGEPDPTIAAWSPSGSAATGSATIRAGNVRFTAARAMRPRNAVSIVPSSLVSSGGSQGDPAGADHTRRHA